jgi:plasmid stabilization system protein ParE
MTVEFAVAAVEDLRTIRGHYETQREGLGLEFAERLNDAIDRISRFPESGQIVGPGRRRVLLSKFPYGVYYRCEEARTLIVGIIHLNRHASAWRRRYGRS